MHLHAVFFDLDGTLLDTATDLARALNRLLVSRGKPALPLAQVREVVSDGAYAMLELGFGVKQTHPTTQQLRESLLNFYLDDIARHTQPFPGISELIEQLANNDIAWGIVTNKPWTYTEPLMKFFHFASAPQCVICPDHVSERKPHPEALLLACAQTNTPVANAVYIGDHPRDIECGKRAHMLTIAAGYGYIGEPDAHRTWGADHTVDAGGEIWPILRAYL